MFKFKHEINEVVRIFKRKVLSYKYLRIFCIVIKLRETVLVLKDHIIFISNRSVLKGTSKSKQKVICSFIWVVATITFPLIHHNVVVFASMLRIETELHTCDRFPDSKHFRKMETGPQIE